MTLILKESLWTFLANLAICAAYVAQSNLIEEGLVKSIKQHKQ